MVIGKRAAEAMDVLITGEGTPSPMLEGFRVVQDDFVPFWGNLLVQFKNIAGGLRACGVPSGFELLKEETGEPVNEISRICIEGDAVRIKVEMAPEQIKEYVLCYAYGNHYHCNITDGEGRSIPAFGPLKIADYLKE